MRRNPAFWPPALMVVATDLAKLVDVILCSGICGLDIEPGYSAGDAGQPRLLTFFLPLSFVSISTFLDSLLRFHSWNHLVSQCILGWVTTPHIIDHDELHSHSLGRYIKFNRWAAAMVDGYKQQGKV
ncbi:hypothetical protein DSO57_1018616 [Entomophthora muscae]|uniref:Uncharacterized protein n=1 Tax=Entomophthora muscae TaxID=34485 RepID=A0ACC2RVG8_9FUNG|nr:hypothetical protein DSO57_1018616 [Entomophthora muscae]